METILANNGGEFIGESLIELYIAHYVVRKHGQPYHLQTQGIVERSHFTVHWRFQKLLKEQGYNLDHSLPPFDVCRNTILKIHHRYNHEQHTVTGFLPYEHFYGKTDNNWGCSPGLPLVPEEIFSEDKRRQMQVKAREQMELYGAKAVARSLCKQKIARKMPVERIHPLKTDDTVLVANPRKAMKARSKGRVRWVAVGKIVKGRSKDKFKIRWLTQGPNKADVPNAVSTRSFGQQYLGRPPKDCPEQQLKNLIDNTVAEVYEVECMLARYFNHEKAEDMILVKWAGWPPSDSTWEPKEFKRAMRRIAPFLKAMRRIEQRYLICDSIKKGRGDNRYTEALAHMGWLLEDLFDSGGWAEHGRNKNKKTGLS
ncbi:hypothetical protein HDU88_004374 [Geranomyces variabilis]|nr:hypothetical protein HDU88_004374 [Geranomyces variabilis]